MRSLIALTLLLIPLHSFGHTEDCNSVGNCAQVAPPTGYGNYQVIQPAPPGLSFALDAMADIAAAFGGKVTRGTGEARVYAGSSYCSSLNGKGECAQTGNKKGTAFIEDSNDGDIAK